MEVVVVVVMLMIPRVLRCVECSVRGVVDGWESLL